MPVEILRRLQPLRSLPLLVQYGATALIALAFFGLRYLLGGLELERDQLPLFVLFMLLLMLLLAALCALGRALAVGGAMVTGKLTRQAA